MDNNVLHDLLMFALPSGFLGSLFAWLAGRRKQSNDMLGELQKSINLLSTENQKILAENIQLRRENADLKANQEEMLQRIGRLTKEVERLRRAISKRTGTDYEPKKSAVSRRPVDDGLCFVAADDLDADRPCGGLCTTRQRRGAARRAAPPTGDNESATNGSGDPPLGTDGTDPCAAGDAASDGAEPP